MLYLSLAIQFSKCSSDVVFVDGVSAPIPILRLTCIPVLFYCHFPDKLLCVDRSSPLKRLYRRPLDWIEQYTTGMANVLAVNSNFTSTVFKEAFPQLSMDIKKKLLVLYPPINFDRYESPSGQLKSSLSQTPCDFCSINRFERKKGVSLAIQALYIVHKNLKKKEQDTDSRNEPFYESTLPRLTIAGGYDKEVRENIEYLEDLKCLAAKLGLQDHISFRPNVSEHDRAQLLSESTCILYTPDREHFGIVPLEAMYAGTPVIAVSSGGPLETVIDGKTGFLCENAPNAFAIDMLKFITDPKLASSMSDTCHSHVVKKFGLEKFGNELQTALNSAVQSCATNCSESLLAIVGVPLVMCLLAFFIMYKY